MLQDYKIVEKSNKEVYFESNCEKDVLYIILQDYIFGSKRPTAKGLLAYLRMLGYRAEMYIESVKKDDVEAVFSL